MDLTWTAPADNVGVAGYRIVRDGVETGGGADVVAVVPDLEVSAVEAPVLAMEEDGAHAKLHSFRWPTWSGV